MQTLKEYVMDVLNKFGHNIKNFGIGLGLVSMVACGEADVKPNTDNGTTNPSTGVVVDNKPRVLELQNSKVDMSVLQLFPQDKMILSEMFRAPQSLEFLDQNNNLNRVMATNDNPNTAVTVVIDTDKWDVDSRGDYWTKGNKSERIQLSSPIGLTVGGTKWDTVNVWTNNINSSDAPLSKAPAVSLKEIMDNYHDIVNNKTGLRYKANTPLVTGSKTLVVLKRFSHNGS